MVFPVVMYGCDSWTVKKAGRQRIDAFELWCWRRLLRVPWTARRSNQSILKEISPEYSLEGLMLKLKLRYFGHLMQRADSFEKTLMLGKTEGRGRRGWQRMRWLNGHEFEETLGVGDGHRDLVCCDLWGHKESDMTEWLNWTELTSMRDECNCPMGGTFFSTTLLGNCNEEWPFPACGHCWSLRFADILNATPWWHHPLGFWIALLKFWDPMVTQMGKRLPVMWETWFDPWVGKIPWRRKWQPIPVLLPRKFHGWGSLVGYSPWGHKESDMTAWLHFHFHWDSLTSFLLIRRSINIICSLWKKKHINTSFIFHLNCKAMGISILKQCPSWR